GITHIEGDWCLVAEEAGAERRNLTLTRGDYPEAFYRTGVPGGDIAKYGEQGVFVALNDLIDQYMPNLTARMEEYPALRTGLTFPDGNIYSLPGGLPPLRGHGGCLRCEREVIGLGACVGVRGQVAAPGVAALGVVAGQPAEHLSTAGLLVGEACGVSEDLALRRRVEGLRHRVVGAGADGSHGLGHAQLVAELGVGLGGVDRAVVAV